MRRFLLLSVLFVAATVLACDEDPIAPPTTGGISLRIVVGTQPQQSPEMQTVAATDVTQSAPVSTAPSVETKARRSEANSEEDPIARIDAPQSGRVPAETAPPHGPVKAPSAPAAPSAPTAIDNATIHILGPTPRTLSNQEPGSTVTVENLQPGSYTVVLLGLTSGELDHYGETSVTVVAGENRTATLPFTSFRPVVADFVTPTTDVSFEITFPQVPGADSYIVEFDTNTTFPAPTSGSVPTAFAVATVPDTGTYYVRARAVNDTYAPTGGGWGEPKAMRVLDDQDPSGPSQASAYDLGFGTSADTTLSELNILPVDDEDWYSVNLCVGDVLEAETWAQRHTPMSGLDTRIELYDATGTVLIDENDDLHADSIDSRLTTTIPNGGTYYLKVYGWPYMPIGQYDLSVTITEGPANRGTYCEIPLVATNSWTGAGDGTTWSDPANWLNGLPTATDTVSIPAGATPVLTGNVSIAGMSIEPSGHVDTDVYDLEVSGDLSAGNSIIGNGTVRLTGDGVSLSGGVPNLLVTGDVSLFGPTFATGDVQVGGALRLNGHGMAVQGMFSTIDNTGILEMSSAADTLAVGGLATFAGGSTNDMLTAGTVILGGGITAQSVSASFAPSGTHRVEMLGAGDRTVTDVVGLSYFNDLALQTYGTVTVAGIAGQAQITGQLMSDAAVTPRVTGGNLLAFGVAVQNMVLDNARLAIGNGTITALDGVVFQNFPANTPQLVVNRDGGTYTFTNLQFSQANDATDVYIEAGDANTEDGDQLTINLASASPADGAPGITIENDAVVNWTTGDVGPPAKVAFTVQPSNVLVGDAILPAVEVTVQDAQTLTVDTSTANITIGINDNPSSGTLGGTTTVAAVDGVATFADLTIAVAGIGYTLIASSPGLTAEASIPFVVAASIDSVVVSPSSATLIGTGATQQLSATAFAGGGPLFGVPFMWASDNGTVAMVNASGLVTSVGQGTANISASVSGGPSGNAVITVQIPASVEITPGGATINEPGNTANLTASLLDEDGAPIAGQTFSWASLNTTIATVNASSGVVTSVANGEVSISAETSGIIGYGLIQVTQSPSVRGNAWTEVASPSIDDLQAIWGTSPTNMYAVGYGESEIYHYNGGSWTTATTTAFWPWSIWGSSATDIFAVGYNGGITHYDGADWSTMSSGTTETLFRVWGTGPTDVFAVGGSGTIIHYDGSSWSPMTSGTIQQLHGVWGAASDNVYTVGSTGTILHWDGTDWTPENSGTAESLYGVWGTSASEIFVTGNSSVILQSDGSTWSTMTTPSGGWLWSIWGTSSNEVFAVGTSDNILQYDGASWISMPTTGTGGEMRDVWGFASGDIFAVGLGQVFNVVRGASVASFEMTPEGASVSVGSTRSFTALPLDADDNPISYETVTWTSLMPNVATVDATGVATGVGDGQTTIEGTLNGFTDHSMLTVLATSTTPVNAWGSFTSPTTDYLRDMWGTADDDIWAVGSNDVILHYNGIRWSGLSSGTGNAISGIWGSSATDIYAVGAVGTIVHYNGSNWIVENSGTTNALYSVWGASATDVFAVGTVGTVLHNDGTGWTPMSTPVTTTLYDVWGFSGSDVYAVGSSGTVIHYDGTDWTEIAGAPVTTLLGVWGTASNNVYIMGFSGTLVQYNGSTLTPITSGVTGSIRRAWGSSASDVYFAAASGEVVYFNGGSYVPQATGTADTFEAIWGTGTGDVWAMGANGTIVRGIRGATGANFGQYTDLGGNNIWSADHLFGQTIVLTQDAVITTLGMISRDAGAQLKMGIYTSSGGYPADLVVEATATTTVGGRNEVAVDPVFLPAGAYWFETLYDVATDISTQDGSSVPTPWAALTYTTSLPVTFPAPNDYTTEILNYYMLGYER